MKNILVALITTVLLTGCFKSLEKKGFSVSHTSTESALAEDANSPDSVFRTRPRDVLKTRSKDHRLTIVFKINYDKKTKEPFIGSTSFHYGYSSNDKGNNWNHNIMPGFEAVYGYNIVNVSHYNNALHQNNLFFETPGLIKTLYYPTFSNDTLNGEAVNRNFYMVSVYDEDTNNDGKINVKDLRRFYSFNIEAKEKNGLIPKNYSVMSSEYDSANDLMYVFARIDENGNGQMDDNEEIHIFWIDLKDPTKTGRVY
ncbi:MAG: Ca2+-binding EF-hand superfamily protein [Glaciecola sp.]|jgi:Ca2+-binding EF-hand superfamily protein